MGPRVSPNKPVDVAGVVLPVSAAALGVVTLLFVPRSDLGFTTHAGASPTAAVADLAAGLGLLGAGLAVWLLRPGSGFGLLVSLAGLAWFAADWVGWEGGPPMARSVAMAVAPFFLAFVVHIVMASPGGQLRSRRQRLAAGAVYAAAAIVSVGRALVRDPFLDPYCWSNCRDNLFLISAQPAVAQILDRMWLLVSLTVGLLLAALATRYLISATPTARRTMAPILVPGVLLGFAIAAHALALLRQPLESPRDVVFSALFQVQALGGGCARGRSRLSRRALVASPGHPRSARVGSGGGAGPRLPWVGAGPSDRRPQSPCGVSAARLGALRGRLGNHSGPPYGGRRPSCDTNRPQWHRDRACGARCGDRRFRAAPNDKSGRRPGSRLRMSGSRPRCWPNSRICVPRALAS